MDTTGIEWDQFLDRDLIPIIEAQRARALSRPPLASVTLSQMRMRAAEEFAPWNADPEPIAEVRDFEAAGVPVRLYDPAPGEATGVLIYVHGGGWVIGDLDLEDAALRRVAMQSCQRIVSVDYRLAPEHPFPKPLDDVETVFRWAAGRPAMLEIDPLRLALGGASAGANLALGAALRLRDRGEATPSFLLLMYGAYAGGIETESMRAFGDGRYGLPEAAMKWFWTAYAGEVRGAESVYAFPLQADLAGLPPVFANHAGLDILRDDTLAIVQRLRDAGVVTEHRGYEGAVHGFTQYARACGLARRALNDAAEALREAIG